MTIREAIAHVDAVCDNAFPEAVKYRWLSECEARVFAEVMLLPPDEFTPFTPPADADHILSAPPPFDEVYTAYLSAKVLLAQREDSSYAAARELTNSLFAGYAAYYAERYDPAHGGRMPLIEYPTFVRGETVTLSFRLPVHTQRLGALLIVFKTERGSFEYTGADCLLYSDLAELTLGEEQTLALPEGVARVSIVGGDTEGRRFECFPPLSLRIAPTAHEGVL